MTFNRNKKSKNSTWPTAPDSITDFGEQICHVTASWWSGHYVEYTILTQCTCNHDNCFCLCKTRYQIKFSILSHCRWKPLTITITANNKFSNPPRVGLVSQFCLTDNIFVGLHRLCSLPSVLWHCWLGRRKGIRPVKTERWGVRMVVCLERGADLHMAQLTPLPLTVSCSS